MSAELAKKITRQNLPHLWRHIQQEEIQRSSGRRDEVSFKEDMFAILWEHFVRTTGQGDLSLESEEAQEAFLRNMWIEGAPGRPSQGWRYQEQRSDEFADSLPSLSHAVALETEQREGEYKANRTNRLKALGNAIVPQVAMEIFRAIKATEDSIHG